MKMLEFLYTDVVTDIPPDVAVPLLIASEQYLLDRLKGLCEDAIRKVVHVYQPLTIYHYNRYINPSPSSRLNSPRSPHTLTPPHSHTFTPPHLHTPHTPTPSHPHHPHTLKGITVENVIPTFLAAHRHRAEGLKEICLEYLLEVSY